MDCQAQTVVISGSKSVWKPVNSNVPQGSLLGPVQFNVFINNLYDEAESTLRRFADNTKLEGLANRPQMDLNRLDK